MARRALDEAKKSMPSYSYRETRQLFDKIAKTISKEADAAFTKAVKTDAIRNLFPTNKSGGTSIFKSVLGSIAGLVPLAAMSPVVQGAVATGIGAASRVLSANAAATKAAASLTALSMARSRRRKDERK